MAVNHVYAKSVDDCWLCFLFLGIIRRIEGRFEVPAELQRPSLILGLVLLITGLVLNYVPTSKSSETAAAATPVSTPTTRVDPTETPTTHVDPTETPTTRDDPTETPTAAPVFLPTNTPINLSIEIVDRKSTGDGVTISFSEGLLDDEIIVG